MNLDLKIREDKVEKMNVQFDEKIERIKKGVQQYVNCDKILFVFLKSNNDNCIVFLYDEDDENPLIPMWLHLEPKDTQKHLREGNVSLMSPLNEIENELIGCDLVVDEDSGRFFVKLKQTGMQSRNFELVTDADGKPAVISNISGYMSRLDFGYCVFKDGIMIPEYFILNGLDMRTGERRMEKIVYTP